MPAPVPFNAPIESFLERFRSSIKIIAKALYLCHVGLEKKVWMMADLAANASAVATAIEKKLPSGVRTLKNHVQNNHG